MLACAQLFGFLMGLVFTAMLHKTKTSSIVVSVVTLVFLVLSTGILWSVEEDMRRQKYEEERLLQEEEGEGEEGEVQNGPSGEGETSHANE